MVSTIQIKPALQLQPYISCYALRWFNTMSMEMPKPIHAVHETYLTLFLKGGICELRSDEKQSANRIQSSLVNLLTTSQGCTYWKGEFVLFCVQFKTNGLFAIFGIPQHKLVNSILPADDLLGNCSSEITERLAECKNIAEMGWHMDNLLIKKLQVQKHTNYTTIISATATTILRTKGNVSPENLAFNANMSLRNFERKFTYEVGMSPKLYARITRFYLALEEKMLYPQKRWYDIAYQFGYFDQAHFIKEVKEFSSKAPQELFKDTTPATETFIAKVEY